MQGYAKSTWNRSKPYLLLAALVLIAYLPVSSLLFGLKNDAYTGYFPPKFILSELVWAKQAPWWNPYINFGYPFYGDMSAGFWSPFTWITIALGGYNAYSFTFEVLGYLVLASWGFYRLGKRWNWASEVRIILALAYACSGYMVGHLQHVNWISGAAILPWVCAVYWRIWDLEKSCERGLWLGFWMFLLVSTAHPGISIAAVYFLICIALLQCLSIASRSKHAVIHVVKTHGWAILAFLLFSAGMLAGYADILPWFERGEKLSLTRALEHPSGPSTWMSFFAPLVTVRADAWMPTDISMRNWFMGIFPLLCLLPFHSVTRKKQVWGWLLIGLLFLALSAGGWVKMIAYHVLPGLGYVRLNGEFRIFTMLAWLIASGYTFQAIWAYREAFRVGLVRRMNVLRLLAFIFLLIGIFEWWPLDTSGTSQTTVSTNGTTLGERIKYWMDTVTMHDMWMIQALVTASAVISIGWALRQQQLRWLRYVLLGQSILFAWLLLPFTGVGKMSTHQIQAWIEKSPAGVPIPVNDLTEANRAPEGWPAATLGHWSMYSKAIGPWEEVPYPITLRSGRALFETATFAGTSKPWAYIKSVNQTEIPVVVKSYSPTKIELQWIPTIGNLQIFQVNYPAWKINQQAIKSTNGLLEYPIHPTQASAVVEYNLPHTVRGGMIISLLALSALLLWLAKKYVEKKLLLQN